MDRQAIVQCSPAVLRSGLGPLFDHGLTVMGSLDGFGGAWPSGVLMIAGEVLPVDCDIGRGPRQIVKIDFVEERYGQQSVTRVSAITLTGFTEIDLRLTRAAAARRR